MPVQPYNNWLSKVALHIIVNIEKSEITTYILYITYRLELFENIGFKFALSGVIVCYASEMVRPCVP